MNKYIIAAMMFLAAGTVSAEMTLNPSSHPVYSDSFDSKGQQIIVGYISNIDWDAAQAVAEARNGQNLPIIGGGVDVTDEAGVVYKNACSQEQMSRHNCVVLVNTPAYRQNMIESVKELKARGVFNSFAWFFKGWANITK